jgi:NADH dehydrogenase
MATIGRNEAVVELPNGLRFHGFVGWLMWLGLHLIELMGFRNRANVFVNWAWNYLTYDHGSRLLLDQPDREGAGAGAAAREAPATSRTEGEIKASEASGDRT